MSTFDQTEEFSWYAAATAPRAVAVIGASTNPVKNHYLDQLITYGYKGRLYPINARADEISGIKAYPSIGSVPELVDLALIALPAQAIPQVVKECVDADVRTLYVMAAGFSEAGEEGRNLEDEVRAALAHSRGRTRMLGPNGTGIISVNSNLIASPLGARQVTLSRFRDDGVAMASQSGLVASATFIAGQVSDLGVAKTFSLGNQSDVSLPDLLEAMSADDELSVVLSYLEGLNDARRFVQAARKVQAAGKHLVVLKGGMTTEGAAAAATHTAAISGEGRVFSGVMRQVGAIEGRSLTHMIDVARVLAAYPDFSGQKATILTDSGGYGIMLTDLLVEGGFELAEWGTDEVARLKKGIADFLTVANPLDGSSDFAWARPPLSVAFECAESNAETDFVVVALGGLPDSEESVAAELVRLTGSIGKPVFLVWMGGLGSALRTANRGGLPAFADLRSLAEALAAVRDASGGGFQAEAPTDVDPSLVERVADVIAPFAARGDQSLDEVASKELLESAGLPVVAEGVASNLRAAVALAVSIDYPVVMKLRAPGLMHKSELGAISLGVSSAEEVQREWERLMAIAKDHDLANADVVVQTQVEAGVELLLGMHRDATFGPVITVGLGGVLTEALDDAQVLLPEVTEAQFRRAFASLRHQRLVGGYRHLPPVHPDVLWPAVKAFSELVRALPPTVTEVDVNPLVVYGDGSRLAAVDALVVLGRP
jgi:acetate---CoA ligase (ADP-forming)